MGHEEELAVVRRAYAKQVLASVGVNDPRVEAAFAAVEREHYLGPGPWPVLRHWGYTPTPDADPVYLYSDVLIGIVPERGLNNGMPSYHAPVIASAGIRRGEHVVHVGAGIGYYTAIMAHLVGSAGRSPRSSSIPSWRSAQEPIFPSPQTFRCLKATAARYRSTPPTSSMSTPEQPAPPTAGSIA